jgi:hypothetical protein
VGLFNKKTKSVGEDAEDLDPVAVAAHLIAGTDEPGLRLGVLILVLLQAGSIGPSDLERLGISEDELVGVFSAFKEGASAADIAYDLDVRAAMRRYDYELAVLAARRGIETGTPEFTDFRSAIAEFAHENSLTNISAAYRLMVAECPERIPGRLLN